MTKKTLYVSDMDGTLLNSHSVVSDTTTDLLNHLIAEHDLLFTVATARTPATVSQLMARVNTPLPYIVMAGAALWDNAQWEYHNLRTIDNGVIAQLLEVYAAHALHPFIYRVRGNCIYAHHVPDMNLTERAFLHQRLQTPLKRLVTSDVLEADLPDPAVLVYSMGDYDAVRAIADDVERKQLPCTFMCYHDIFDHNLGYLEIYAQGTTKAAAIQQMAHDLQADRVVVFGDNLNDLPMMKVANWSVAVGNAFDEVKTCANEIIATNDEDAVARWIANDLKRQTDEKEI